MLHMLLEHSKAGKAVGTKGMMIQNIKIKSGALAIRIDKEPLEIHGITLRKLTIEGSLNSVRRSAAPPPLVSITSNNVRSTGHTCWYRSSTLSLEQAAAMARQVLWSRCRCSNSSRRR